MQISTALAPPCEEKARLLRLASVAEANHHRAIQELTWRVGALQDPNFKVLQDLAEGVRKLVDDARKRSTVTLRPTDAKTAVRWV